MTQLNSFSIHLAPIQSWSLWFSLSFVSALLLLFICFQFNPVLSMSLWLCSQLFCNSKTDIAIFPPCSNARAHLTLLQTTFSLCLPPLAQSLLNLVLQYLQSTRDHPIWNWNPSLHLTSSKFELLFAEVQCCFFFVLAARYHTVHDIGKVTVVS